MVVLSDFFVAGGGLQGLRYLVHRGLTPAVLQIVAPEEAMPLVDDDIELVDVEDIHRPPMIVDDGMVAAYQAALAKQTESLRSFCASLRLPWARLDSTAPFGSVLSVMETAGLFTAVA